MDDITRERARIADYLAQMSRHLMDELAKLPGQIDAFEEKFPGYPSAIREIIDGAVDDARKGRWLLPLPDDWEAAYCADTDVDYLTGEPR